MCSRLQSKCLNLILSAKRALTKALLSQLLLVQDAWQWFLIQTLNEASCEPG